MDYPLIQLSPARVKPLAPGGAAPPAVPRSGYHPTGVLSVTVYSSDCELYFGLISARRTMPDLQQLHRHIEEAFVELTLVSMTKDAP